jgi:NAD(P)-dependent dehydrogenase (short-subunit alcohol dehydrogenase family)
MASNPTVLITGGNAGLGLEIVKALAQESTSFNIIIGSRDVAKGEEAVTQVKTEVPNTPSILSVVQIDVLSDDSIRSAVDQIASKYGKLDTLVNNAGGNFDHAMQAGDLSVRDGWNLTWNTNVTGAHVMTSMSVPLLLKSSNPRLLFITSGTSPLTETERMDAQYAMLNAHPEAGWPKPRTLNPTDAYRSSKTGLNMMMRQWYRILKKDNVKVFAVSPGFLATGLAGIGAEMLRKVSLKYILAV